MITANVYFFATVSYLWQKIFLDLTVIDNLCLLDNLSLDSSKLSVKHCQ